MKKLIFILFLNFLVCNIHAQSKHYNVTEVQMLKIYNEVKTPFKYGLIVVPPDDSKKMDCPSIFRKDDFWYMTYIVFDGKGYETWLAKSADLLSWENSGRILSYSDSTDWDVNQKAGYISLQDYEWGGKYELNKFQNKYWMSYLGGNTKGYEAGLLSVGIAFTDQDPGKAHEWQRLSNPVLLSTDQDTRWWENKTIYKSTIIGDRSKTTGYPFVMYYNAKGDSISTLPGAERIGMAVSEDMVHWKRFLKDPVLNHHKGITGDAYIQKIKDKWVMFYFGAFWKEGGKDGAFNRFACSYDLVNWTDWTGDNLIQPSETYDSQYAHKSFVVKWKGVVYHFYCAVNNKDQRGIAVATSKDLGKSKLTFISGN